MNLEIIHNFEKFLENKGYSPHTIHTYTKALEQVPDSWNVTDPQLLYEHINHTLTDNNQTFTPVTRHNIRRFVLIKIHFGYIYDIWKTCMEYLQQKYL